MGSRTLKGREYQAPSRARTTNPGPMPVESSHHEWHNDDSKSGSIAAPQSREHYQSYKVSDNIILIHIYLIIMTNMELSI